MPEIIDKTKTTGYEKITGFNVESYGNLHNSHVKRLESSLDGIFIQDLNTQLFGET
jgi:hypothetical protein